MNCPNCNCELIWSSDFDYESVGVDGEGMVSFYSCPDEFCNVDSVQVYTKFNDNEVRDSRG